MRDISYADEPYCRLYKYDHPDWTMLSWQAQGLLCLLRRKADRAGLLPLGMNGIKSLAGLIGHRHCGDDIEPYAQELIEYGWIEVSGGFAIIPDFIESESAQTSLALRSKRAREKRRDLAKLGTTNNDNVISAPVTSLVAPSVPTMVATSGPSIVAPSVPTMVAQPVRDRDDEAQHSTKHNSTDQIPPTPPTGGSGGKSGRESKPVHDDPNLEDIRRKLLAMPPPLRHLPSVRAEERLYAPVMSGALTLKHALQAIDDAAVSLGPDLGSVQPTDRAGMTNLEKFVAGCLKQAQRNRNTQPQQQRHAAPVQEYQQPSPEALDALDRFREMYTSTGGYDRYVVGPDDTRLAAEAIAECAKHGDAQDILLRALDSYMRDDFYSSQGHTLKRFVAVLKSEPARFIGRRKHVETEEEKLARGRHKQLMEDLAHLVAP